MTSIRLRFCPFVRSFVFCLPACLPALFFSFLHFLPLSLIHILTCLLPASQTANLIPTYLIHTPPFELSLAFHVRARTWRGGGVSISGSLLLCFAVLCSARFRRAFLSFCLSVFLALYCCFLVALSLGMGGWVFRVRGGYD